MRDLHILFERALPTGGFVRIDGYTEADGRCHAVVRVERRGEGGRRFGHPPPIIAEADGSSEADVLGRLASVATDNVALASALLRWQARRAADQRPAEHRGKPAPTVPAAREKPV